MSDTTVRVCRLCGTLARLEVWEHHPDDPWGCDDCVHHILEHGAGGIPDWVIRQSRTLRAVS